MEEMKDEDAAIDERRGWLRVLANASAAELESAWSSLPERPPYRFLRSPEIGLAMVRGRIGGNGRPFNLGEMTMTRATVQLTIDGRTVAGFGHIAGRDARHAELVAAFDALLQVPDRRRALMSRIIAPLAAAQAARNAAALGRVAASRVEFFTLVRGD